MTARLRKPPLKASSIFSSQRQQPLHCCHWQEKPERQLRAPTCRIVPKTGSIFPVFSCPDLRRADVPADYYGIPLLINAATM
jgi:hypothetical protein